MRKSLFIFSILVLLSACDNGTNSKTQFYPIEQKKKMEKDLNESLERSIDKLKDQEEL